MADPITISLIAATVVSTTSAVIAIFRKNLRALNCFGRSCIQFKSNTPDTQTPVPVLNKLPALQPTSDVGYGRPRFHSVVPVDPHGNTIENVMPRSQNQSPPTNININFDHGQPIEEHNSIRISQI